VIKTAYANTFRRMEIKYLLSERQTEQLLERISGRMAEDGYSRQTTCSLYCDSPDLLLARLSMDKPVYKEKLRLRSYGNVTDSSPAFLEIKKKFSGIVYKRRIPADYASAERFLTDGAPLEAADYNSRQVAAEIRHMMSRDGLLPRAAIFYDRRAFHGADDPELRLTLDNNIRYRTDELDMRRGTHGKRLDCQPYSVMEIKSATAFPAWLVHMLSEFSLVPGSYSKYGEAYLEGLSACRAEAI